MKDLQIKSTDSNGVTHIWVTQQQGELRGYGTVLADELGPLASMKRGGGLEITLAE